MWSNKYEKCVKCGTISTKHKGHGLCRNCWLKDWTQKNYSKRMAQKRAEYERNKERYKRRWDEYVANNYQYFRNYWRKFHLSKATGGNGEKVLSRDNYKCLLCSGEKQLIIHHIDGDLTNNEMSNLATLCRRCHPKIHYSKNRVKIESELHRNMQRQ